MKLNVKRALPWLLICFCCTSLIAAGQEPQDLILGKWKKTPGDDLVIEVFRVDNEYKGKISWSNDETKKPAGFLILERLTYNEEDKSWENGKIHSPSGGSYSATARLRSDGTLEVHGYKGMKWLGRKKYFKRVQ